MPSEQLESVIDEAVAAARSTNTPKASVIDLPEAQQNFDALLDEVERGREFIITREGKAVARLIPPRHAAPPAPEWLEKAWKGAKERGVDALTQNDIGAEIAAHRREAARRNDEEE